MCIHIYICIYVIYIAQSLGFLNRVGKEGAGILQDPCAVNKDGSTAKADVLNSVDNDILITWQLGTLGACLS